MSLKERAWLIIILLLCILVMAIFLFIHQINVLFQIVYIYCVICAFMWGMLFVSKGVKQLRQERQEGKNLRWNQNLFVFLGMGTALPPVLGLITHQWSTDLIGHTNWWIVNLIEIIVASVFLVFLLFFEVGLTVGFIRTFLNSSNPSPQSLESISSEEGSSE